MGFFISFKFRTFADTLFIYQGKTSIQQFISCNRSCYLNECDAKPAVNSSPQFLWLHFASHSVTNEAQKSAMTAYISRTYNITPLKSWRDIEKNIIYFFKQKSGFSSFWIRTQHLDWYLPKLWKSPGFLRLW